MQTLFLIIVLLVATAIMLISVLVANDKWWKPMLTSVCLIILLGFAISLAQMSVEDVKAKTYTVETVVKQDIIDGVTVSSDTTYVIRFEK